MKVNKLDSERGGGASLKIDYDLPHWCKHIWFSYDFQLLK